MCARIIFLIILTICFSSGLLFLSFHIQPKIFQEVLGLVIFCQIVFGWPLAKFLLDFILHKELSEIKIFIFNLCNGKYQDYLDVPNEHKEECEIVIIKRNLNMLARVLDNYKKKSMDLYAKERQKNSLYKEMVNIDPLTKIPNRRGFENEIQRRTADLLQKGKSFYLLFIDLDDFKQINDTYGHQAGDETLRFMGEILRNNIRSNDFPCRFGGDEFGVFLDDCAPQLAYNIAKRIQKEFAKNPQGAGASIGGRKITPNLEARDLNNIIHLADEALYEAKKYKNDPTSPQNIIIN